MFSAGKAIKYGLAKLLPGTVLIKGKPQAARVALTFDDGPHPQHTESILDILDRGGAKATFFLQGKEAEKYPALVRKIFSRGHQLGNHGYGHLDAKRVAKREYIAEVERAQQALQNIVGAQIDKIFRPPYGNITGAAFLPLALAGYLFVFWSVDSRDSFIRTAPELVAHVETIKISAGDIVLLHEDYAHTVAALPTILQSLSARSLGFSKIDGM
ncbi:MAG: polysaccharide deacetylase family protein [Gammaproteobacteria bacterium]|nr:polysaccharide deacetylase family protein [Gammaproteobacteria bacterium]